jgi:uncharacterized protein YkwD
MIKYYLLSISTFILLTACQKEITTTTSNTENISNNANITNLALEKHNSLRQKHFSDSKLIYSLRLEADAQEYANLLANKGTFTHDPNNLNNMYGENLYRFSGSTSPDFNDIIQKWYSEEKYYNHRTQECQIGKLCGHYTQIVWKKSKLLGCASAQYTKGSYKNGYVTVCKYYPYGNIIGKSPY